MHFRSLRVMAKHNFNVIFSIGLIPDGEKDTSLARLNIYRVSTDDVGNYRCIGSNGFGFSSAGATLIGEHRPP